MGQGRDAGPAGQLTLTFEAWRRKDKATQPCLPADGPYSRTAWLPVLGPPAWLVWGFVAHLLPADRRQAIGADEVARAHRITVADVGRALHTLVRYGLAYEVVDNGWKVCRYSPPLPDVLLAAADPQVRVVHRGVFRHEARHAGDDAERWGPS